MPQFTSSPGRLVLLFGGAGRNYELAFTTPVQDEKALRATKSWLAVGCFHETFSYLKMISSLLRGRSQFFKSNICTQDIIN